MQEQIQARVSHRILETIDRMFVGDAQGRITEVLQNARRAGAKNVWITRQESGDQQIITVQDDGTGVGDFASLLDAGRTDWDNDTRASEDPAGMGLFSLVPRTLMVHSVGKTVCIEGSGWQGAPIPVIDDPHPQKPGTKLVFKDEGWYSGIISSCAKYSGMVVHVDDETINPVQFLDDQLAKHLPELGVRLQVHAENVNEWREAVMNRFPFNAELVYLNFFGQVVAESTRTLFPKESPLASYNIRHFPFHRVTGVEMTGEPTDLRLVLPARTGLVENAARGRLGEEVEKEIYRSVRALLEHQLSYKHYERAKALGIDIGESMPYFDRPFYCDVTFDNYEAIPDAPSVVSPETEVMLHSGDIADYDCTGAEHLELILQSLNLSGCPLGRVPIGYEGYSWAKNTRTVKEITVRVGPERFHYEIDCSTVSCVEHINYEVKLSDGETLHGSLGVAPASNGGVGTRYESYVAVTPHFIQNGPSYFLWAAIGGWDEDTQWETASHDFDTQWDDFCDLLIGPNEAARRHVFSEVSWKASCLDGRHPGWVWKSATISSDGDLRVRYVLPDGSEQQIFVAGNR